MYQQLVLQVRPCAAAGRSDRGDDVAPLDPLPDADPVRGEVTIASDGAVTVGDEARISEPAAGADLGDDAVGGGDHLRPDRRHQVEALVEVTHPGEWIAAPAVAIAQEPVDRIDAGRRRQEQ